MKKFRKIFKTIKDVFIVLGIPALFYYAYQIHQEQINTKNHEIELLKTKIEVSKDFQIDEIWNKYKSLKEFSSEEIIELSNKLTKTAALNDSLKQYIAGSKYKDSTIISLTRKQAIRLLKDLAEGDYNKKRIEIADKLILNYQASIKAHENLQNNQALQIKSLTKVIEYQEQQIKLYKNSR